MMVEMSSNIIKKGKSSNKKILSSIVTLFYDKVFSHPELKLLFSEIFREQLENSVVEFMSYSMGLDSNYEGLSISKVHQNMFVTEHLFEERRKLVIESFHEFGADFKLLEQWLKIDDAFKDVIVKKNIYECVSSIED